MGAHIGFALGKVFLSLDVYHLDLPWASRTEASRAIAPVLHDPSLFKPESKFVRHCPTHLRYLIPTSRFSLDDNLQDRTREVAQGG